MYAALPAAHQALVSQGRICEGMSEDAVFLAWGRPGTPPYVGQSKGKSVVRWQYEASKPVFVANDPWMHHACGSPYHFHHCEPYYDVPGVAFVPCTVATVIFENGKVVSWERRGR